VTLLAFAVGEGAEREQVVAREQPHAVVERQAFAGLELRRNVTEARSLDA
jgi:hypothetical protein